MVSDRPTGNSSLSSSDALLAVVSRGGWPGAELAALAGYAQAEVLRHVRHPAKAEPRDLAERRSRFGKARHAAGNTDHKARRACPATAGSLAGLGDQFRSARSMRSAKAVSQNSGNRPTITGGA
jgi:hypothetical protein